MVKEVKLFKGDKPRVYLIDVTNRDGVQTARISLSKLQKTILNMYLNRLGVFQSEIGFPALGNERNYQTYLDRVAEMRANILRTESDIVALRRELAKLPQ